MLEDIKERYSDITEISRGSTSIVYTAKNKLTNEKVAIKKFVYSTFDEDEYGLSNTEQFKRFKREIEIHLSLSHENIIQAREYYENGIELYLILDYIPAQTLQSIIENKIHLDIFEILNIVRQIAEALNYMENKGIIHRDIKPGNILITNDKKVLVIDFGCAKKIYTENLTMSLMLIGTVNYMSPEQLICHKDIDGRADLFSLGCIFYQMLSGVLPFRGSDIKNTINNILKTHPIQIRNINPYVPYKLEVLIHHTLKKDPDHRCSTARQLIFHINKIIDEPEVHYSQGKYYEAKKDFKKAYSFYKRAIQTDDSHLPSWKALADLYYIAKDWTKALEYYYFVVKNDSSNPEIYSKLGDTYKGLCKYNDALKMYQKSWFFEPDNIDYYLKIAGCLYLCNKTNEAIESYLSIIEKNSQCFKAMYELGIIYYKIGKYTKAREYLEVSLEFEVFNQEILICLASLYQELEEYKLAIDIYIKLESISPDSHLSLHNLACAYYQIEEYENAEKKLIKLIQAGKASSHSYILLGLVYESLERTEDAIISYENSIRIDSINISAYLYLASCIRSQWKLNDALEILKKALKVNTKYSKAEIYYQMAELYLEKGQYEESKKCYKECLERSHSGGLYEASKKQLRMLNANERKARKLFSFKDTSL